MTNKDLKDSVYHMDKSKGDNNWYEGLYDEKTGIIFPRDNQPVSVKKKKVKNDMSRQLRIFEAEILTDDNDFVLSMEWIMFAKRVGADKTFPRTTNSLKFHAKNKKCLKDEVKEYIIGGDNENKNVRIIEENFINKYFDYGERQLFLDQRSKCHV